MAAQTQFKLRTPWAWPQGAFAARMIIASLLSYWVLQLMGYDHGYSAVFSALIVVRPYQQGALRAGIQRLLATALGIAMAFVSVLLRKSGLNDYELLILALGPLTLLVAYDSGYRTAMISALLMLSAPFTKVPELDIAMARALVVSTGAVIGIAVSVLVLPRPHAHVVSDKALDSLKLMFLQLSNTLGGVTGKPAEKEDQRLRKALYELGQVTRDHRPGNPDDDLSFRLAGLTRHCQALCLLLRAQWRRKTFQDKALNDRKTLCNTLVFIIAGLQKPAKTANADAGSESIKSLFRDISALETTVPTDDDTPETWLLISLARNLAAIARLTDT